MDQEWKPGEMRKLTEHLHIDENGHIVFTQRLSLKGLNDPEGGFAGEVMSREIEELPEPLRSQVKESLDKKLAQVYALLLKFAREHKESGSIEGSGTEKERGCG